MMHDYTNDNKVTFAGNRELTEYFQMLLFLNESTDDYLFLNDLKMNKIYFTKDITKSFPLPGSLHEGYSVDEWMTIVYGRDAALLALDLEAIYSGEKTIHNMEYRLIDREGNLVWISCRGKVMLNQQNEPAVLIGRVSYSALAGKTDSLTGLKNGAKLLEELELTLKQKASGTLLVLGIDNFKHINKKYGRGFGNSILKKIASLLETCVADHFQIYRLDGDRFAINLVGYQQNDIIALYQTIQLQMINNYTLSAGAVVYPISKIWDANTLFNYAESSLDRAKQEGKNRLSFFSEKEYEEQLYFIDLTEEMQRSIQNQFQGFSLHFQPQFTIHTYEIIGAEALLRYHSPYHGNVSPEVFISILEQNGMIVPVGYWVLKEAMKQCKKWRAYSANFRMSINLSYVQLQQKNFSESIFELLDEADLPGDAIILELTESMQLQDYRSFNQLFYQWERRGIQVSIDDFGTGYSSLSYLKGLAIDEIKIDRCFVSRIHLSAYNYHLLHNMLELAHTAQIRVCCEGVESLAELQTLEQLYPDVLQGFYFSKPLPAAQFAEKYFKNQQALQNWRLQIQKQISSSRQMSRLVEHSSDFKTVLDQMEEIVFICDIENHELYYMNPSGKRISGISDYEGRKCYEVLQGQDKPCKFCINQQLQRNTFHVSHFDNAYLKHRFLLKDKLITWNGRTARLEIAFDLMSFDKMIHGNEEALYIEQNVVQTVTKINTLQTISQAIQELLKDIGEFYMADRSYIFLYSQADHCWCNLYEWCEHQVESQQVQLLSVPDDIMELWVKTFCEAKTLIVKDIDQYQADEPELWNILNMQNIHRLMVSPMIHEGTIFGFIGVDNPKYLPYDERFLSKLLPFATTLFTQNNILDFKDELIAQMSATLKEEDILKATKLGLWIIQLDTNTNMKRMFVDQSMNDILGVEESFSSEDYYQHWYQNISDGYYDYVNHAVQEMLTSGKIIELEYTWNHPVRGEVPVRCVGVLSKVENGVYTLKGYHRIVGDMVQKSFLKNQNSEMFEYNESKHTIYFHTNRILIAGEQRKEVDFPTCWITQHLIHPYFIEEFQALFSSVKEHCEVQKLDLLLKNKSEDYEWFRIETHHIGNEEQDLNTLIVSLYPIMENQTMQFQYVRKDDFYQAMLSETIAYAELDLSTGMLQNSGGLWEIYTMDEGNKNLSLQKLVDTYLDSVVAPEDRDLYYQNLSINRMQQTYKEGKPTISCQFRRKVPDMNYHWMELVIHVFQEQVTEKMYALLYLKDIDDKKQQQLKQEQDACRDPLTNALNRRMFEQSVQNYMLNEAAENAAYALVMLDLDNFKQVNDTLGHYSGDAVLKTFVATLREVFQENCYISRLGGDEFAVFIKQDTTKERLNDCFTQLFQTLNENKPFSISCSIGITFTTKDTYHYDTVFKQADAALYYSKRNGKGIFCYWEEVNEAEL